MLILVVVILLAAVGAGSWWWIVGRPRALVAQAQKAWASLDTLQASLAVSLPGEIGSALVLERIAFRKPHLFRLEGSFGGVFPFTLIRGEDTVWLAVPLRVVKTDLPADAAQPGGPVELHLGEALAGWLDALAETRSLRLRGFEEAEGRRCAVLEASAREVQQRTVRYFVGLIQGDQTRAPEARLAEEGSNVRVWLDPESCLPIRLALADASGSQKGWLALRDVQVNPELPDDTFVHQPKPGETVVERSYDPEHPELLLQPFSPEELRQFRRALEGGLQGLLRGMGQ